MYSKWANIFRKACKKRVFSWFNLVQAQKISKKIIKKVCRLIFLLYLCTRNTATGCSAVRLAHLVWDQRVPGSNPGTPTKQAKQGDVVRHLFCFWYCDTQIYLWGVVTKTKGELIYQLFAERSFSQPCGEHTGKALSEASISERSSQSWYPDKTSEARRCHSTSLLFLVLRHTNLFVGRGNKNERRVDLSTSCGTKKP